MAITKLTFTKIKAGAKASLRYYVHRLEEKGERITRTIFGRDGKLSKYQAYKVIGKADRDVTFYRMMISPDRKTEDKDHRLNMRDVTEQAMRKLQKILKTQDPLDYLGVEHRNTKNRHVHAISFVKGRISKKQLRQINYVATLASMTEEQRVAYYARLRHRSLTEGQGYPARSGNRTIIYDRNAITHTSKPARGVAKSTCQVCPVCLSSMAPKGGLWKCANCGMAVSRGRHRQTFRKRRQLVLEQSLTKEVGRGL